MNRQEQKERLRDIITLANEAISSLRQKEKMLTGIWAKIDTLDDTLGELVDIDSIDNWDAEELKQAVANQLFTEELENLLEELQTFQDDLEAYADEIPDYRREQLEERYEMLDEVIEKVDQSTTVYEDLNDVIEAIEDNIRELQAMRR